MKILKMLIMAVTLLGASSAFAKRKASATFTADLGTSKSCIEAKRTIRLVANSSKDLLLRANCEGSVLTHKWTVKYVFTPTQRFSLYTGFDKRITGEKSANRSCNKINRVLNKLENDRITFNTICFRSPHIIGGRIVPAMIPDGYYYNVEGKVILE